MPYNLIITTSVPTEATLFPEIRDGDLSVDFTYQDKKLTGILSKVNGAAAITYHLLINKTYWGQLVKTERGWQFSTQDRYIPELAEYFGELVDAKNKA